jgi:peptidoglycan/xylan/chitin deacetylase (PgdA/CDA1 family)
VNLKIPLSSKNKFITVFLLVLLCSANSAAQSVEVEVKKWADNKKSAFAFTFDDSFLTDWQYTKGVLEQFNFKGTFYIIPGQLNDTLPGNWRYATWSHYKIMAAQGHEIASHSITHPDLTTMPVGNASTPGTLHYELYKSKEMIETKIPGHKVFTFAYPYTAHNYNVRAATENYYISGRAGNEPLNPSSMNTTQRFSMQSKIVHFSLPRNTLSDDLDELYDFQAYINQVISNNGFGMLLAHEVYPFAQIQAMLNQGAYHPLSVEWLTLLGQFAKQKSDAGDLWVETVANIIKYMRQRDNFSHSIVSNTSSLIEFNAFHNLNNTVYNYPLTVDVTIPYQWEKVIVNQSGSIDTAQVFAYNGKNYVRIKVVPNGGSIKLTPSSTSQTFTVSGKILYHNITNTPVAGVQVKLQKAGGSSITVNTDVSGNYFFNNVLNGNYTLTFSKTDGWGGVNATDALLTLNYFAGSVQLDNLQKAAADVNNSNSINATDALLILRRFAALQNSFPKPDWIFEENAVSISVTGNITKNVKCIITGDVNRSYSGGGEKTLSLNLGNGN